MAYADIPIFGQITFEQKSYRDRVWNERQTIQSRADWKIIQMSEFSR